jgi:hypothetical protein
MPSSGRVSERSAGNTSVESQVQVGGVAVATGSSWAASPAQLTVRTAHAAHNAVGTTDLWDRPDGME